MDEAGGVDVDELLAALTAWPSWRSVDGPVEPNPAFEAVPEEHIITGADEGEFGLIARLTAAFAASAPAEVRWMPSPVIPAAHLRGSVALRMNGFGSHTACNSPAATCVSKTLVNVVRQARRRIATSWRPACSTTSTAGSASTAASGAGSPRSSSIGSSSTTSSPIAICTRQSSGR